MKPRNRTIGPAHAIDEHVYELERVSGLPIRWAFAMLKLVADREGRFPWLPNRIKREVWPYDVRRPQRGIEPIRKRRARIPL
jgi:hypothetical protein